MSEVYPAQSGVPLPKIRRGSRPEQVKYPLRTMGVGEFFFVPARASRSMSAYVSREMRGTGRKFRCRSVEMVDKDGEWVLAVPGDEAAVSGTGVWRIK